MSDEPVPDLYQNPSPLGQPGENLLSLGAETKVSRKLPPETRRKGRCMRGHLLTRYANAEGQCGACIRIEKKWGGK